MHHLNDDGNGMPISVFMCQASACTALQSCSTVAAVHIIIYIWIDWNERQDIRTTDPGAVHTISNQRYTLVRMFGCAPSFQWTRFSQFICKIKRFSFATAVYIYVTCLFIPCGTIDTTSFTFNILPFLPWNAHYFETSLGWAVGISLLLWLLDGSARHGISLLWKCYTTMWVCVCVLYRWTATICQKG